jgi:uncharacterized FlaG/YvyC family protein
MLNRLEQDFNRFQYNPLSKDKYMAPVTPILQKVETQERKQEDLAQAINFRELLISQYSSTSLKFQVSDKSGRIFVDILDENKEVIRSIPSEQMRIISEKVKSFLDKGVLLDEMV